MVRAALIGSLCLAVATASLAESSFVLTHHAFSSVGGSAGQGTSELSFTAGQPAAGIAAGPVSSRFQASIGFWRWMLWRDATDVGDETDHPPLPGAFRLDQNYPNPFNPQTTIRFAIPASSGASVLVSLRLYDVSGRLVRVLSTEQRRPGTYSVTWDGRNDAGVEVRSGIYFCKMKAGSFEATRRLVLVK